MKTNFYKTWLMAFLAILTFSSAWSQSDEQNLRYGKMMAEEEKIAEFINSHLDDDIPKEVYDLFVQYQEKHGHDHERELELSEGEKEGLDEGAKRLYLRALYFKENPEALELYQPMVLGPCVNGDLEMGDYTGFAASSGLYGAGECTIAGISFVPEAPGTLETPVTISPGINCEIMNVGLDPILIGYGDSLQKVHSGNHSIRVNQNHIRYGVNRITYPVVLTQPNEDIAFWFSFVLQNPIGHVNSQPFFRARAVHQATNVEQDFFCETALERNNFTTAVYTGGSDSLVWTVWRCAELEVSGNVGDTVILDITTADCNAGGHWGYSYIDDICTECLADSCNYQGSIDLDPTDTCSTITQVCGTYDLAALQCTTATVNNLTLNIYQGGVLVNTLTSPTIDLINQTFCFNISPGDFGAYTGGFDFEANITFDINGSLNTETDLNTNPGPDNDYLTDASCCPKFRILDCCEYWDLSSRSSTKVDRVIEQEMAKYRSALRAKYGAWVDTVECTPCNFPNDQFPIFVVDDNGNLVDDSYYDISWTHHPGWTAAFDYIFPNQGTVVTVEDSLLGCTWTDSFYYDCCDLDVNIVPLCTTCDPCSNPGQPFFMVVEDQNGNPLSTSGYSFLWSTSSTASGINGVVNTEYWVEVTDLQTGCTALDTFEIECCDCEAKADFVFSVGKCDVKFTNLSASNNCSQIVDYMWDFGDGNTSNIANPNHSYSANGTYEVCLITVAYDGTTRCMDTVCQKVTIKDCDPCHCTLAPYMDLSIDKCEVKFEGFAGNNACTQVLQYYWSFGDGTNSNLQNPVHTYPSNGTYTVCFTVEGTDGKDVCKQTICKEIEIRECKECPCDFEPKLSYQIEKCEVRFTGDAGANSCTKEDKYYWDFGDGNTSNLQNPVHTYATNGSYTVCFTVEGNNGKVKCKEEVCEVINIRECRDCKCEVESNFIGLFGVKDPCTVYFNESATTNSCTQITGYKWDFGDGTTSTAANPAHTFPGDGVYTVCLDVYGSNGTVGCKDKFCKQVTIKGCKNGIKKSASTEREELNDFGVSVYPNPFNDELSLTFENPTEQKVEITLLNASGKQVSVISNESRSAGKHEVRFDGSNLKLSSGVYFIVIRSNSLISYKKVVFDKQ